MVGLRCLPLAVPGRQVKCCSLALPQKCKPHKRPVCGSNGKTYLNHCELHRDACLTGSKIQVDYDGHCKGNPGKEGCPHSQGQRVGREAC